MDKLGHNRAVQTSKVKKRGGKLRQKRGSEEEKVRKSTKQSKEEKASKQGIKEIEEQREN